jgi:peptidoglycan/xylan/chitin deacetylase (PgdA/CDA1 family)
MPTRRVRNEPGFAQGIVFHRFVADGDSGRLQGALTPSQLESLLRFAQIERILSPDDWLKQLANNTLGPNELCLTFDDGLRSQRELALPVLQKFGLRAFFFICSGVYHDEPIRSEVYSHAAAQAGGMDRLIATFLERCPPALLTRLRSREFDEYCVEMRRFAPWYSDQDLEYRFLRNRVLEPAQYQMIFDRILRECGVDVEAVARSLWLDETDLRRLTDAGHYVGLHSWDHPYEMERLSPAAQRDQYERNRAHLTAVTGRPPVVVAHPLNSYDKVTLEILRELGVWCGFRANAVAPPGRPINAGPLELAREDAANVLIEMAEQS